MSIIGGYQIYARCRGISVEPETNEKIDEDDIADENSKNIHGTDL